MVTQEILCLHNVLPLGFLISTQKEKNDTVSFMRKVSLDNRGHS